MYFTSFAICLITDRLGSHIGEPYNITGFIRLSNKVRIAVKETLDLITVLLRPKNARVALVLRMSIAVFRDPDLWSVIP